MKKDVIKFLKRLQGENGVTEISDLTHNLGGLDDYESIIARYAKSDLYFISFIPNEKWKAAVERDGKHPRTKNEFVGGINYFKADFDIRSYIYENQHRVISEEELMQQKDKLLDALKQDEVLSTYSAVVHSGNGIHVYRIGYTMDIDSKIYSVVSTKLYDKIRELLPDDPQVWPDYACGNIGRMLRLPGSVNYKEKYGLPPHEVELLEYNENESLLVWYLDTLGNCITIDEDIKKDEIREKMNRKYRRTGLVMNGQTYEKINSINIADLVCEYTGRKLASDGINFVSNRDGKNTGAFIVPEENVVVHTGTPHFSDYFKVYSPFSFLMVHYANKDPKKTFEIAKEKFPRLKDEDSKYLFNKGIVKNG